MPLVPFLFAVPNAILPSSPITPLELLTSVSLLTLSILVVSSSTFVVFGESTTVPSVFSDVFETTLVAPCISSGVFESATVASSVVFEEISIVSSPSVIDEEVLELSGVETVQLNYY